MHRWTKARQRPRLESRRGLPDPAGARRARQHARHRRRGLVPLAAMIGSGVDMSRAYMAKTRLQSACDAAALAGRRVMQNDTMTTTVTNEAAASSISTSTRAYTNRRLHAGR